jgi:hypothetical protein
MVTPTKGPVPVTINGQNLKAEPFRYGEMKRKFLQIISGKSCAPLEIRLNTFISGLKKIVSPFLRPKPKNLPRKALSLRPKNNPLLSFHNLGLTMV